MSPVSDFTHNQQYHYNCPRCNENEKPSGHLGVVHYTGNRSFLRNQFVRFTYSCLLSTSPSPAMFCLYFCSRHKQSSAFRLMKLRVYDTSSCGLRNIKLAEHTRQCTFISCWHFSQSLYKSA